MIIDNKNSSIKKRTLLKSSNCNLTDIDQVKLYNSIPYSNDLLLNLNSLEPKKLFMKINNENKENMSKLIISLVQNKNRSLKENQILALYLTSIHGIRDMMKDTNEKNLFEFLFKQAEEFYYEYHEENRIIFRKGELGDKFYIIIVGKVYVLVPEEISMNLSDNEFISYLLKLKKYKELDLLDQMLSDNPFFINNDLNKFLKSKNCENPIPSENLYLLTNAIQKQYEETVQYLENKEDKKITIEEYINRISVNLDKFSKNSERKEVIVYSYNKIVELKEGDRFGETSLIPEIKKRTASIITEKNCHLICMNKDDYQKTLLDLTEKHKKAVTSLFIKNPIFKMIEKKKFLLKYYNLFTFHSLDYREILIKEKEVSKYVYFIKSGDYEVSINNNLLHIHDVIKWLEGEDPDANKEKQRYFEDNLFENFFKEIRYMRVAILKTLEVAGLDFLLFDKNIDIFSVKAISNGCDYYRIEKRSFKALCETDPTIKLNLNHYLNLKRKNLIERLLNIKNYSIKSLNAKNEKKEIINIKNHLFGNKDEEELFELGFISKKRSLMNRRVFNNCSPFQKLLISPVLSLPKMFERKENLKSRNFNQNLTNLKTVKIHNMKDNFIDSNENEKRLIKSKSHHLLINENNRFKVKPIDSNRNFIPNKPQTMDLPKLYNQKDNKSDNFLGKSKLVKVISSDTMSSLNNEVSFKKSFKNSGSYLNKTKTYNHCTFKFSTIISDI